jgi:hypothetical protein
MQSYKTKILYQYVGIYVLSYIVANRIKNKPSTVIKQGSTTGRKWFMALLVKKRQYFNSKFD